MTQKKPGKKSPGKSPEKQKKDQDQQQSLKKEKTKISSQEPETTEEPTWREISPPGKEDLASTPSSPPGLGGEETEKDKGLEIREVNKDLRMVCGALAATGVMIWRIFDKDIDPLDKEEKETIADPLAECAEYYGFENYLTKEIRLGLAVSTVVAKRIIKKQELKKQRAKKNKS